MVNHQLAPHGIAYSGGPGNPAPGHHFEVTMIQLYKVALSAGKAHRSHKHHHAHHFDHNGEIETPRTTTTPAVSKITTNFLDQGTTIGVPRDPKGLYRFYGVQRS